MNEIMQRKAAQVFVGRTKKAEMDKNIGTSEYCCEPYVAIYGNRLKLNCSATARVEVIRLVDRGHLTLVTFKEIEG